MSTCTQFLLNLTCRIEAISRSKSKREAPFLFYDPYRYYHFFKKAREPHGKDHLSSKMGGPGSGNRSRKSGKGGKGDGDPGSIPSIMSFTNRISESIASKKKGMNIQGTSDSLKVNESVTGTKGITAGCPVESSNPEVSEMIHGLGSTESASKPPVERSMIEKISSPDNERVETTYRTQVLYRNKVNSGDVDVVEKLKCVMARLIMFGPSVQMIPYCESVKYNPIGNAKDIPNDPDAFKAYVPMAEIHPKTKVLRMCFKISADLPLWKIKIIPNVKNYLNRFQVYISQQYLMTFNNVKVGGLILSHCQWTRRDVASSDLNIRINENETEKTPVQLTPFTMWHGRDETKISTKLLAVECAAEHIQLVKHRMFTKLLNVPPSMQLSNTKVFKFIPFNADGSISDKVIRSGIYLQNKFLIQCTAVTMINLTHLDWVVPNQTGTFKAIILAVKVPNSHGKVFSTAEMGILDNKVHLVTTKANLEYATEWIDMFSEEMNKLNENASFWEERTGCGYPPKRINAPIDSDARTAYANFLSQTFSPLVGEEMESTGSKSPPSKSSYSRVVYGSPMGSTNSSNTSNTAVSTITSEDSPKHNPSDTVEKQKVMNNAIAVMQEKAQAGQQEMKKSLLQEMRELNKTSAERMDRMDDSSKTYDNMLRELHQNNMAKSQEMAKYEMRLQQISETTVNTNEKIDTTNQKVDKLSVAMKHFIQVMADVIGANGEDQSSSTSQDDLRQLVSFLEEEEEEHAIDMDLEETNNKRKTSPGTEDALGGEGDKK